MLRQPSCYQLLRGAPGALGCACCLWSSELPAIMMPMAAKSLTNRSLSVIMGHTLEECRLPITEPRHTSLELRFTTKNEHFPCRASPDFSSHAHRDRNRQDVWRDGRISPQT